MADYALVVGIERYETPAAATLQGPSLDALRFALWLFQKQGLQAENIILIQNKCDKWQDLLEQSYEQTLSEVKAAGIAVRENPSRHGIQKAWFEELLAGPEELGTLWLYWSGHGVTFPQNREAVLCSDVSFKDPSFIFLAEFRDSLRSQEFKRFNAQRLIVDACAEYLKPEDLNIRRTRSPATWSITETPEQIELNAVAVGRSALAEEGGSRFSRILLDELNRGGWPTNLRELYESLEKAIGSQSLGEEDLPRLRVMSPRFEAGIHTGSHTDECNRMLQVLARCQISFESYQPFYMRTVGGLTSDAHVLGASNLTGMIWELLQLEREAAFGYHSQGLVEFLERVTREFKQSAVPIEEWLHENVPPGARKTLERKLERELSDLVLTIRLNESKASPDGFPVAIHADLSDASFSSTVLRWNYHSVKDTIRLEDQARVILTEADAQARRQKGVSLRIQVFANPPLMGVPWHAFRIDPDDDIDSAAFGDFHSFVLRSRARLARAAKYDLESWKQKARALRQRPCCQITFSPAPAWGKDVNDTLAKVDGLLLIRDTLGTPSPATECLYKLLSAAMRRGLPLASWPIVTPGDQYTGECDRDTLEADLKKLFQECDSLAQTPERLRSARKSESWARRIALFWDDDDTDKLLNLIGEEPSQI